MTPNGLAALTYATYGWHVLPIHRPTDGGCSCGHAECDRVGKHPMAHLVRHGVNDASADPMTLEAWWETEPWANVGLATGANSGVVALDVDPDRGGDASLTRLQADHGALPETLTTRTGGGGRHLFFAYPSDAVRSFLLGNGVEVKSDGTYVVMPPSRHPSRRAYRFIARDWARFFPLPVLPNWIIDRANRRANLSAQIGTRTGQSDDPQIAHPHIRPNARLANRAHHVTALTGIDETPDTAHPDSLTTDPLVRHAKRLPPWVASVIRRGTWPERYPSRSHRDYYVAQMLWHAGLTFTEIKRVFHIHEIGRDLAARHNVEDYLHRTIHRAHPIHAILEYHLVPTLEVIEEIRKSSRKFRRRTTIPCSNRTLRAQLQQRTAIPDRTFETLQRFLLFTGVRQVRPGRTATYNRRILRELIQDLEAGNAGDTLQEFLEADGWTSRA